MSLRGAGLQLRKSFSMPKTKTNWFPGHMSKGMRDMARTLKDADLVIEVHDARIPISGRNTHFKKQVMQNQSRNRESIFIKVFFSDDRTSSPYFGSEQERFGAAGFSQID